MKMKSPPKVCKKGGVLVISLSILATLPFFALAAWIVITLCLSDEEGKRLYSNQKISTDSFVKAVETPLLITKNQ
ncbi:hypothetical protein H7Y21_00795 [Arenimonas sp.]|nr:hypothetical protein [Candidatus Parcubacteria bacterium]